MNHKAKYSKIGALETQSIDRTLDMLTTIDKPIVALKNIIQAGKSPDATAFERYASTLLQRAGAHRLPSARASGKLQLIEPENGRLAQFDHPGGLPSPFEPALLSTECAINRLICIADAINDGRSELDPADGELRRSISILGGGFLSTNAGWRSARVVLPDPQTTGGISPRFFNEVDWRLTDCVASNARAVFQSSMRPNAYRNKLGVDFPNNSDWDVRTRLAQILRALELPHRYSFRFDYNDSRKSLAVLFTCPPPEFLPQIHADMGISQTAPIKETAYQGYLIRLACLFSAACFGSGRDIQRATVVGYDSSWEKALVSAQFTREDFVQSVLMRIDSDEFSDPKLRFDPQSIADMVCAVHIDWLGRTGNDDDALATVPDFATDFLRTPPWDDERPLGPDAQVLFHCSRICDVDTSYYYGGHGDAVDLARSDSDESPLSAILRLEALVEDLESALSPPNDDACARPLYAADPLSRLAIGLLDDDLAIGAQAQAFLQGNFEALADEHDRPRYFRAPSALYHAHFGLSCLYQELEDFPTAQFHADRCMALAPTTVSAYYRKADVLTQQGFLSQAANVIIAGLNLATDGSDCSLLYFHLGMLLLNIGEKEKAAAVHSYNAFLNKEYSDKSKRVLEALQGQIDAPTAAFVKPYAASRLLAKMRLPVAPVNIRHCIAPATILLANSGSPESAAPYARLLERQYGGDEVVTSACRSIQYGINLQA